MEIPEASIILDSISPDGKRITTFKCRMPRWVLAEFNTHRRFSRNTASSRAIPVSKFIDNVLNRPALPLHHGAAQKGMQAEQEVSEETKQKGLAIILNLRDEAVKAAQALLELGYHKQVVNRYLEPWMMVETLCTATEFENFFALRAHPHAEPHIKMLAYSMLEKYNQSIPTPIDFGGWHIPFGDRLPEGTSREVALKVATARAARVSYLTFEGNIDISKDIELHDQLANDGHWSAFEHAACCVHVGNHTKSNFEGWVPYRKHFMNEERKDNRVVKK